MSITTLKSIAQRGSLLVAVAVLAAATIIPSLAFADALNPLTKRSLLLSSSAPGYQNSDGAGNTALNPNSWNGGEYYAPPGSGPNGQKTGQTFTFNVSTDSAATSRPIKAFTLQYCTTAAGKCQAPGNNTGDARELYPETGGPGDLVNADTGDWDVRVADRQSNATAFSSQKSDLDVVFPTAVAGEDFEVWVDGVNVSVDGNDDPLWTVTTSNEEDLTHSGTLTGKQNFITLASTTGVSPAFDDQIQLIFKASDDNYITNPGADEFFVKINTYDSENSANHLPTTDANLIDGGVTVANVMTDSIHITTKVLETMSFSVGTENRDNTTQVVHGSCDPILALNNNRLQLGNPDAEYSLETGTTWDVHSYWRLSSNSSGGATVYYSGDTLRNTVGDHIAAMATKAPSLQGAEQFGLALRDDADLAGEVSASFLVDLGTNVNGRFKLPELGPLAATANYDSGSGRINPGAGAAAQFTFLDSSQTVPVVIAQNSTQVISCATAKVRYIANIGADTPAGVYTTKINYLAAPQY